MSDLIDRQAAIDAVKNYWKAEVDAIPKDIDFSTVTGTCDMIMKHSAGIDRVLEHLPSAQPKTGKWIYGEHGTAMCDGYKCNQCGFFVPWDYKFKFIDFINDYHFCPHCGARMKE